MDNRDDNDQSPMQRLIQYVPDAAMKVLDQCVNKSHEDQHHPDMKVTFCCCLFYFIIIIIIFVVVVVVATAQGRSQPHSPRWARVPLSSFFLNFHNFSYISSDFPILLILALRVG